MSAVHEVAIAFEIARLTGRVEERIDEKNRQIAERDLRIKQLERLNAQLAARIDELEGRQ